MSSIQEVATAAGVSRTTVSRYLNRKIKLPNETMQRIEQAIRDLDYRPNALARRLSLGRSETIGLVTPEIANPFFAEIAARIEARAAARGLSLFVSSTAGVAARELDVFRRLEDRVVDGLIVMTNRVDDGRLAKAINRTGRVVLLDEDVPGADAPRIFAENRQGAAMATAYLIEEGHRRIAHVGGPEGLFSAVERAAGNRDALRAAGIEEDPGLCIFGPYTREQGRAAGRELLKLDPLPTAVFCGSDILAIGLIETLRDAGRDVPGEISVVGFDDMPFTSLLHPSLTTVHQPVAELGDAAFDALLALIEADPAALDGIPPPRRLPVRLEIRASVAPPRSPDP